MRLALSLTTLLLLSGCDAFFGASTVTLPPASFAVTTADTLVIGTDAGAPVLIQITNLSPRTVYIDRREVGLYRVAEDGSLESAFGRIVQAYAAPPTPIPRGETLDAALEMPLRLPGRTVPNLSDWTGGRPVNGEYVVGTPLYDTGGEQLYIDYNTDDLSVSEPFRLTFVEPGE